MSSFLRTRTPVLTVHAPWAHCIIEKRVGKDFENRSWKPPASLVGKRIGIHVARAHKRDAFLGANKIAGCDLAPYVDGSTYGCIIGTVFVAGFVEVLWDVQNGRGYGYKRHGVPHVVDLSHNKWLEKRHGNVGWWLRMPIRFDKPIPAKGQQNIWYAELPTMEIDDVYTSS